MKRSTFSEEQMVCALRQAESGTLIADVCRQLGLAQHQDEPTVEAAVCFGYELSRAEAHDPRVGLRYEPLLRHLCASNSL